MQPAYPAQDMIDAIRAAYSLARATRSPAFVIEQNGELRAVQRSSPSDRIVIRDVEPPRWNAEIERAIGAAYQEFADAEPALRRAAHIMATSASGPRDAPDVEEIAEEVMRRFCMAQDIAKGAPARRRPPKRIGFFTRMFGSAR